jgi:hypothetical protein
MSDLKPANENPWYVLMTLYGEQDGDEIDWELHTKNRNAWNILQSHSIPESKQEKLTENEIYVPSRDALHRGVVTLGSRYQKAYKERNPQVSDNPQMPSPKGKLDMRGCIFSEFFVASGMVFGGKPLFSESEFKKAVIFHGAGLSFGCSFDNAVFQETLDIHRAVALGDVNLQNARFASYLDGRQLKIYGNFELSNASIEGSFDASKNMVIERCLWNGFSCA